MFNDYVRCVKFESEGNISRALQVMGGLIRARVKHDIGPFHFSLFRFADIPSGTWKDYLRDRRFYADVTSKNPKELHVLVDDKLLFYQHCLAHELPTPKIIGVVGRRTHASPDQEITHIGSLAELRIMIESGPRELFVKPVDRAHGNGAFIIRRFDGHFYFGQPEREGSLEDLYRYLNDILKDETALLIQPRIQADPGILRISSVNGLATIRIVTAMMDGNPTILYACVRLPVGTNITDNFSSGKSGNLAVAIDIETGALSKGWYSVRNDWPVMKATSTHPSTGQTICGTLIPQWPEVVDLALRAQKAIPGLKSVGWDIAVTEGGVTLIEANDTYGVAILQVAYQRGLRSELLCALQVVTQS